MSRYQSFPGASGDSLSLQKLQALHIPSLAGRSFLDVGCNEGFFCGYARFDGANRVVGIDKSTVFIERARRRFPDCEFLVQGWDRLPEGPFDVILLASSLHYAADQPLLIRNLMSELAPDGAFVLELGVHANTTSEWVQANRDIDKRLFPTWRKIAEVLEPYAWKHIAPSVLQHGDPVPRHVIHVRHRKPVAYLLMEPPAFGKSTISRSVFQRAAIKVISGDTIIARIADGTFAAPPELTELIRRHFSPLQIDQVVLNLARAGLLNNLVQVWLREANGQDFALDAYIPGDFHAEVSGFLSSHGYMPVKLTWNRVGEDPVPNDVIARKADAYFARLRDLDDGSTAIDPVLKLTFKGTTGAVEQVAFDDGRLTVRGWAVHESGAMPELIRLTIGQKTIDVRDFTKQSRPDVQKHFGLSNGLVGYVVTAKVDTDTTVDDVREIEVFGGQDDQALSGPFRKAGQLAPGGV